LVSGNSFMPLERRPEDPRRGRPRRANPRTQQLIDEKWRAVGGLQRDLANARHLTGSIASGILQAGTNVHSVMWHEFFDMERIRGEHEVAKAELFNQLASLEGRPPAEIEAARQGITMARASAAFAGEMKAVFADLDYFRQGPGLDPAGLLRPQRKSVAELFQRALNAFRQHRAEVNAGRLRGSDYPHGLLALLEGYLTSEIKKFSSGTA